MLRHVTTITRESNGRKVTIHRDSDTREYRVRIVGRPAADYFTDDQQDATNTAYRMLNED